MRIAILVNQLDTPGTTRLEAEAEVKNVNTKKTFNFIKYSVALSMQYLYYVRCSIEQKIKVSGASGLWLLPKK